VALTKDQIKHFKTIGHGLNPVVTIAQNGLSKNVQAEIDRALADHELIKVKIAVDDREARKQFSQDVAANSSSELVQEIGKVALFFKASKKPSLKTSNVR